MSELPQGWATANLLTVATMVRGVTYTKDVVQSQSFDNSVPVLRANNIQKRGFDLSELVHVPRELVSEGQKIRKGDVVIASSSGSISVVGKAAQAHRDMHSGFGAFCTLLRPDSILNANYFGYFFSTDHYRSTVSKLARGSNINNLKREHFASLEIPMAPAAEQTRIANQLDTLIARVQACNDRFDTIPALLKRFRQTVLDAASSGALTEDWRGLDDLKQGEWETVALQDVITEMRNGLAQKPTESPPGSKILRIGAVRSGQLNLDDHRYLVVSDKEAEQYALKQDDLLFTRYNGSLEFVGVCAALTHDAPGYVYPDKLIRVRVRADRAIAKFIEIVFGCRSMRTQVESFVKSSAGQRGVSGADLKAAKFSLPPITEQVEIVHRVEALFALADRIETRCTAARAQAQRLTPLVLAKAFRGELVPQDSTDEPASELLARIASSNTDVAGRNKQKVPVARKKRALEAINL